MLNLRKPSMVVTVRGFTLIELLVSMSIFLMIMAMVGNIYTRCLAVSEKSLAILDLHQRANAYTAYLDEDFSTMLSVSAMNLDVSDDGDPATIANIIFMRAAQGGFNRNYPDATAKARLSDTQWVCWHWDHQQGKLYRAESRALQGSWNAKFNLKAAVAEGNNDLSTYGIIPTGQRYFRNFIGSGSIRTSAANESAERMQLYRRHARNDKHPQKLESINMLDIDGDGDVNGMTAKWGTPHFEMLYKTGTNRPKEKIREDLFFGSDGLLNNGFAVANRDGLTYNKDFVMMLGDALGSGGALKFPENLMDGTTKSYQQQMKQVGEMVEFITLCPIKADGETAVWNSDDADGAIAGIAINGIPLDARELVASRPAYLFVHFVLHNVPGDVWDNDDIDGDSDFDESLVQAARELTISTITTGSYYEKMKERRREFVRLLRDQDYYANEFSHVLNLTR